MRRVFRSVGRATFLAGFVLICLGARSLKVHIAVLGAAINGTGFMLCYAVEKLRYS